MPSASPIQFESAVDCPGRGAEYPVVVRGEIDRARAADILRAASICRSFNLQHVAQLCPGIVWLGADGTEREMETVRLYVSASEFWVEGFTENQEIAMGRHLSVNILDPLVDLDVDPMRRQFEASVPVAGRFLTKAGADQAFLPTDQTRSAETIDGYWAGPDQERWLLWKRAWFSCLGSNVKEEIGETGDAAVLESHINACGSRPDTSTVEGRAWESGARWGFRKAMRVASDAVMGSPHVDAPQA